jgi:DNA-binding NtrC family response regulator
MTLSPTRVLVVDDEALIRMAMADHLESAGFAVLEAANAADAMAILSRPDCGIDLVFSDVRMPGELDGIGLGKWVLQNYPDVPVILASGETGKATALEELSGVQVLLKPYSYDAVTRMISAAVARMRSAE